MNSFENQLEVFFREASPTLARIGVRIPRGDWPATARLRGTITGPTSDLSETLTTSYSFTDRSQPDVLLAEAVVPEPSYWTAELPLLYGLRMDLLDGDKILATKSTTIGLRTSGALLTP